MTVKGPCLIVETPRAGRWNGCLIVSEGTGIDHATAVRYTEQAGKSSHGQDYLMVGYKLEQPTTGRMGAERLILAGIDTKLCSQKEINDVEVSLQDFLSRDVEELIVDKIDWDKQKSPSIIERPELTIWLDRLSRRHPHLFKKQWPPAFAWVYCVFGSLAVILVVVFFPIPRVQLLVKSLTGTASGDNPNGHLDPDRKKAEQQKLLRGALDFWRDKLHLTKVDEDSEQIAEKIVNALEGELVLNSQKSDGSSPGLRRLYRLLDEFEQIDPRTRKRELRPQVLPDKKNPIDEAKLISLIQDQGVRSRVMGVFDSYRLLEHKEGKANEAVLAYLLNQSDRDQRRQNPREYFVGSDVKQFREMIRDAKEVVHDLRELKQEDLKSHKYLRAIRDRLEAKEPDNLENRFSPVCELRWSFYTPFDENAMQRFAYLIEQVTNAYEVEEDKEDKEVTVDLKIKLNRFGALNKELMKDSKKFGPPPITSVCVKLSKLADKTNEWAQPAMGTENEP